MDWDKLRIFHTVAEMGSFTHAGERLRLSQSAVSRQIRALEEELNVPLFYRHARGLVLTEQGEILHRTADEIFARLEATEIQLAKSNEEPRGELKVNTTVSFGSSWLAPRLGKFMTSYPEVIPHILTSDQDMDLLTREADVAVRFAPPTHPDLIQKHLFDAHYHIYASPLYVQKYGAPDSMDDLDAHRLITYGPSVPASIRHVNWIVRAGLENRVRTPALRINNIRGILAAVEAGAGIAALPDYVALASPNLTRLLPDVEGPTIKAYFVYPQELRQSRRMLVFRDFLVDEVARSQF